MPLLFASANTVAHDNSLRPRRPDSVRSARPCDVNDDGEIGMGKGRLASVNRGRLHVHVKLPATAPPSRNSFIRRGPMGDHPSPVPRRRTVKFERELEDIPVILPTRRPRPLR